MTQCLCGCGNEIGETKWKRKYFPKYINLEILCYSCHSKEHHTEKNLPYYGYMAVIVGKLKQEGLL